MAKKRMFTTEIIESDAFLTMPQSTQNLYFHLNMHADDDGFVNNPISIMNLVKSSNDDMNLLIAKKFVIVFEDKGLIVIKHWRLHNYLRSDRYKETNYINEKEQLSLDDRGIYHTRKIEQKHKKIEEQKHKYGEYQHVLLKDSELTKLINMGLDSNYWIKQLDEYLENTGKSYRNHFLTIKRWSEKDNKKKEEKDLNAIIPVYDTSNNPTLTEEDERRIEELMKRRKVNGR